MGRKKIDDEFELQLLRKDMEEIRIKVAVLNLMVAGGFNLKSDPDNIWDSLHFTGYICEAIDDVLNTIKQKRPSSVKSQADK